MHLALVSPDPKRQLFELSLISEVTPPVKVNVSYAASQVLGHRLRWGAPRQGLPPCLGLRELQQLKDHPEKACDSWRCVHGPLIPFTAHTLYNGPHFPFTAHNLISLSVTPQLTMWRGSLVDLKKEPYGQGRPRICIQNGSNPGL